MRKLLPFYFLSNTLDKINLMIFNKIKTFYHKNEIIRDYVYMIGLFLNLLDTQTEKDKFQLLYNTYCDLLYWIALKRTNRVEDADDSKAF